MEFGECPYCDEPVAVYLPDGVRLPAMEKIECEHCHKVFVEKHSRIDPEAYKLEDVVIDEEKKTIHLKEADHA